MTKFITTILVFGMCAQFMQSYRAKGTDAKKVWGIWSESQGRNATLQSRKKIEELFDRVAVAGFNTVFLQVYRGNRSWYRSGIADASPYKSFYASEKADPLNLAIALAHKRGVELHAWLNVFRIWNNRSARAIKKLGREVITRDRNGRSLLDYKKGSLPDGGYWLDPGDPKAKTYMLTVIKELLDRYPGIDGIHLDYIRYPYIEGSKVDFGYSQVSVSRFKARHGFEPAECSSGKRLLWDEWRRDQLIDFIREARAITNKKGKKLSVAVVADKKKWQSMTFQDWPLWIRKNLIDFAVPMNYSSEKGLVKKRTGEILKLVKNKGRVVIGLGAYKMLDSPQDLILQIRDCILLGAGGVALFSYDNIDRRPELFSFLGKEASSVEGKKR